MTRTILTKSSATFRTTISDKSLFLFFNKYYQNIADRRDTGFIFVEFEKLIGADFFNYLDCVELIGRNSKRRIES